MPSVVSMVGFTRSPSGKISSSVPERTHCLRDHSQLTATAELSLESQERTQDDVAGVQHFHLQPARIPMPARRTVRAPAPTRVVRGQEVHVLGHEIWPVSPKTCRLQAPRFHTRGDRQAPRSGAGSCPPPDPSALRISTGRRPQKRPRSCRPGCHRCPSRCCFRLSLRRPRCCRPSPLRPRTRTSLPHRCWKP